MSNLDLPEDASKLSLPEYHRLILLQRAEQHQETMSVLERIAYSLNDVVKALLVRNKISPTYQDDSKSTEESTP